MDERERYERVNRVVRGWARRKAVTAWVSRPDMEDLVQEGAIGFEREWAKTRDARLADLAAIRDAIDYLRRNDRNFLRLEDREHPDEKQKVELLGLEDSHHVASRDRPPGSSLFFREALGAMPRRTAEILVLILGGAPQQEVAALYGITSGRVTQLFHEAGDDISRAAAIPARAPSPDPGGGGLHGPGHGDGAERRPGDGQERSEEDLGEAGRRIRDARRSSRPPEGRLRGFLRPLRGS